MRLDPLQDIVEFPKIGRIAPGLPTLGQTLSVARETQLPMREERGRDDRGIMCPMFKQAPIPLQVLNS